MEQKQNAPEYGKNLGLSIFQMICCCQVTGLIALVVTLIANSDYRTGKMDDYEKKMKNANIALIACWIIGAIATIAMLVLQVIVISYKGYYV